MSKETARTYLGQELLAHTNLALESGKHVALYLGLAQGCIHCGLAHTHRRILECDRVVCAHGCGDFSAFDLEAGWASDS
jgi:hypothetical protein